MAPEVVAEQGYTEKSDMWSLGCVLFELVTLAHPFISHTLFQLGRHIIEDPTPPLPADCSPEIQLLVDSLLSKVRHEW